MRTSQIIPWQFHPPPLRPNPAACLTSSFFVTIQIQSIRKSFWFCLQNRSTSPVASNHHRFPPGLSQEHPPHLPRLAQLPPPLSHRGSPTMEAISHLSSPFTEHSVAFCLQSLCCDTHPFHLISLPFPLQSTGISADALIPQSCSCLKVFPGYSLSSDPLLHTGPQGQISPFPQAFPKATCTPTW